MKLPTKSEVSAGVVFITIGLLMLSFFPAFVSSGWYAIFFGITIFLFPGPQLRDRFKQTEETKAEWRQSAKDASSKNLSWWSSPFPWVLLIVLVVIFANVT